VQPLIVDIVRKESGGKLPAGVLDLFGRGHRPWYFEDLWRTPLILAGPGIPGGVRRHSLSANLDVSATILDAVGIAASREPEGRSLWGGRESARKMVFAHGHQTSAVIEAGGAKAIVHPPRMFLQPKDAPSRVEVHDVTKDPLEEQDLAEERPADRDRLAKEIAAWHARSPHFDPSKVSPEQMKTLHNLGYTDDGK
jgi:arylsulfatase A-like enzyme